MKYINYIKSFLRIMTDNNYATSLLLYLARHNLLPKFVWKRLPINRNFMVYLPNENVFTYSSIASDTIGRALFWGGFNAYEPSTVKIFYELARKSNLILDIGANTGLFTLIGCAANAASKVITFEPVPSLNARLIENIKLNGWQDRCQVKEEAVSNVIGLTKFHVPFSDLPSSSSLNPSGFRGIDGYLIEVPVTTIDAICYKRDPVNLVKIDVEGFEDKVLEGMERVLDKFAPTIIIECNPDGPFKNVERILSGFGYRFFHLCSDGPMPVKNIIPDSNQTDRNYLCTVHDKWDELY